MAKKKLAPIENPPKELVVMRWISFTVVTLLFFISGLYNIFKETPQDKTIGLLFLIITGFAWGANIWKYVINKLTP